MNPFVRWSLHGVLIWPIYVKTTGTLASFLRLRIVNMFVETKRYKTPYDVIHNYLNLPLKTPFCLTCGVVLQTKDDLLRELSEEIKQKDCDLEGATEKLEVRSNNEKHIITSVSCAGCALPLPRATPTHSLTQNKRYLLRHCCEGVPSTISVWYRWAC